MSILYNCDILRFKNTKKVGQIYIYGLVFKCQGKKTVAQLYIHSVEN